MATQQNTLYRSSTSPSITKTGVILSKQMSIIGPYHILGKSPRNLIWCARLFGVGGGGHVTIECRLLQLMMLHG